MIPTLRRRHLSFRLSLCIILTLLASALPPARTLATSPTAVRAGLPPSGSVSPSAPAAISATTPNVLTNPGFEDSGTSWTITAPTALSTQTVHTGQAALAVLPASTVGASQVVALTPATTYAIQAWGRTSGDGRGEVCLQIATGTSTDPLACFVLNTTAWAASGAVFTTPAEPFSSTLTIRNTAPAGVVLVDDLTVSAMASSETLWNGDFESGSLGWNNLGSLPNTHVTSGTAHTGNLALAIGPDAVGGRGQRVALHPGGTYRLGGWVKTTAGARTDLCARITLTTGALEWQCVQFSATDYAFDNVTFTVPATMVDVSITIWLYEPQGMAYADDLVLTRVTVMDQVINGAFEDDSLG